MWLHKVRHWAVRELGSERRETVRVPIWAVRVEELRVELSLVREDWMDVNYLGGLTAARKRVLKGRSNSRKAIQAENSPQN